MKDYEFSSAGSEFDRSGQEISLPPPERSVPAEMDRSGREYQQSSAQPAAKKRKRRIRPAMATVAAVVTAVVAVSPLRFGSGSTRTDFPNRVPGEEARAYLDYVTETMWSGDFDQLLSAAQDPRLEVVIREELAPFAMELSQQHGAWHTACGNDGESEDWTTLEEFMQAWQFHVGYDGKIMAWEWDPDLGAYLTCNRQMQTVQDGIERLEAGFRLTDNRDHKSQQQLWSGISVTSFQEGRRSIRIEWSCEEIEQTEESSDPYYIGTTGATRITRWYRDRGEGTERTDWHEEIEDGRYTSEWVYDAEDEEGGYYVDYMDNGSLTVRSTNEYGDYEYDFTLYVFDGVLELTPDQGYEIIDNPDGTQYVSIYHRIMLDGIGETREGIYSGQLVSKTNPLYHLVSR